MRRFFDSTRPRGARLHRLPPWVFTLVLLAPSVVRGQPDATSERRASFLIRALSYDKNLSDRTEGALRVLVVHEADAVSGTTMAEAFNLVRMEGMSVAARAVAFESAAQLLERIEQGEFEAVYIDDSIQHALTSIVQLTRSSKVPSLAGDRRLVERGVSVGVFFREDQPRIVVNLRAAKVEGLELSADLLSIAEVIE